MGRFFTPAMLFPDTRADHDCPGFRLAELLAKSGARRGNFTLASGQPSDIYVDCRLASLTPLGPALLRRALSFALVTLFQDYGLRFSAVGGVAEGGIPLVIIGMEANYLVSPLGLSGFWVRKTPKEHGADPGSLLVGAVPTSGRILLLEDVVTTGGSLRRAVAAIYSALPKPPAITVLSLLQRGAADFNPFAADTQVDYGYLTDMQQLRFFLPSAAEQSSV